MIDNASRQKFFVAVSDCLEKRGFSTHITEEGKLAVRNEKIPGTVKLLCVVEGNGVVYCSSSDLKNVFKKKLLEEVMECIEEAVPQEKSRSSSRKHSSEERTRD